MRPQVQHLRALLACPRELWLVYVATFLEYLGVFSLLPILAGPLEECLRDLCLFDEHTWGSSVSVAKPFSLDTLGQFNEKSRLAWRPMARAEWLLSQRARTSLGDQDEGMYVVNSAKAPFTGWVRLIATCLREDYKSLEDTETGKPVRLYFEPGIAPWGRPGSPEDLSREVWAGFLPLAEMPLTPVPDELLSAEIPLPGYISNYSRKREAEESPQV